MRVLEEAKEDVAGSARDAPAGAAPPFPRRAAGGPDTRLCHCAAKDAAAAAAALQELPKPWAREQEQAAAERANAERAAPLLVQRLQVEPAPSAPHEVQYTLQPPPKRAKVRAPSWPCVSGCAGVSVTPELPLPCRSR